VPNLSDFKCTNLISHNLILYILYLLFVFAICICTYSVILYVPALLRNYCVFFNNVQVHNFLFSEKSSLLYLALYTIQIVSKLLYTGYQEKDSVTQTE